MAGSLSGIGGNSQIAAYNAQSTQNSQQIRRPDERDPQENRVQNRSAPAASSQKTETGNQNDAAQASRNGLFELQSGSGQRGTLLDVTV